MFLNQPLLFQNPLMNQADLKTGMPRMALPQNSLSINQQFNMNFVRKNHESMNRSDENRRQNQNFSPKSPENVSERDFINQNCLKFSIDNILKADFGRRITDPLTKRKTLKSRQFEVKSSPVIETSPAKDVEARVPEVKPADKGAIDLSKGDDSGSNASSTPGIYSHSFKLY